MSVSNKFKSVHSSRALPILSRTSRLEEQAEAAEAFGVDPFAFQLLTMFGREPLDGGDIVQGAAGVGRVLAALGKMRYGADSSCGGAAMFDIGPTMLVIENDDRPIS
jgi:hypothetical protein